MAQIAVTLKEYQHPEERRRLYDPAFATTIGISTAYALFPAGTGTTIKDNTTRTEYTVTENITTIEARLGEGAPVSVSYDDSPSLDAFGRLRTSEPETLFDSKSLYSEATSTYWSEELNGTGATALDLANSCINMDVSANGDYAIRQTRQRFNYQPGKSQLWFFTGIMTPTASTVQRIGCFHGGIASPFNVLDGLCFEANGETMRVVNYKGGSVLQAADQDSWNLDTMDGNGASGITVDWTKAQIFMIDYEWLGVGRVRLGLNIDGKTYYVHEFLNANSVTNVYMRSPNQPIRYEIRSTGGTATLKEICASVQSEGGFNPAGLQAQVGMGNSTITIGTGWELMYAIRLKDTQLDATIEIQTVDVMTIANVNYEWGLFWNPVIAGTPSWADVTGGALEEFYGDGATHNITPIIQMAGGFAERSGRTFTGAIETSLKLGSQIDGTQDVVALGARTLSGTGEFTGALQLKQLT
jgi:hypothetical protein